MKTRSVKDVVTSIHAREGAGFKIRRPFPTKTLSFVDPFLLLDHMEPVDLGPGEAKGAPDHPHRGFETVTYMLEGNFEHRDSAGNRGIIGPGDVQWMTAGAGVVHSEMPDKTLLEKGGRLHGFQIWVNLPASDKMIAPRYQDIPAVRIPVVESEDGLVKVKVVAGESMGARAVIDTRTPIVFLHFNLEPGARVLQPLPESYNALAYVIDGKGLFGEAQIPASADQLVLFDNDGQAIEIDAGQSEPLSVLLLGGIPLNEPVARYGPFVMNTQEQIIEAISDFQNGRMGAITSGGK